jgi:hypothetical protein
MPVPITDDEGRFSLGSATHMPLQGAELGFAPVSEKRIGLNCGPRCTQLKPMLVHKRESEEMRRVRKRASPAPTSALCTFPSIVIANCIITIEAAGAVAEIHDRMPLELDEADWAVWLGEVPGDPAALLRAPADDVLVLRPMRGGSLARPLAPRRKTARVQSLTMPASVLY